MALIALSTAPPYEGLHAKSVEAIQASRETRWVEYKRSKPWADLQWKIIKAALGMGNLKEGGLVIIGMAEDNQEWSPTGIHQKHVETYDTDEITTALNKYISPHLEPVILRVPLDKKEFLAIHFPGFEDAPLICKKNPPDTAKEFVKGGFYVRPPGLARTTKVESAEQMRELIELVARSRARRIIEQTGDLGLLPTQNEPDW